MALAFALTASQSAVLAAEDSSANPSASPPVEPPAQSSKTSSNTSSVTSTSGAPSAPPNYAHLDQASAHIKAHRYRQAYTLLKGHAKQGCRYSQSLLGTMHLTGSGAPKNLKQAAYWFEKSASQGLAEAQLELGKIYLQGKLAVRYEKRNLIPQIKDAAFWLKKAAEQGLDEAHSLIARIPGEPTVEYKVARTRAEASQAASQSEAGIVEGWKGYADVVNTLNSSSNVVH